MSMFSAIHIVGNYYLNTKYLNSTFTRYIMFVIILPLLLILLNLEKLSCLNFPLLIMDAKQNPYNLPLFSQLTIRSPFHDRLEQPLS